MNEEMEMNYEETFEENSDAVDEVNEPINEEDETSECSDGLTKVVGALVVAGAVAVGAVTVKVVKKGLGWVKGKLDKRKVEPDEDGCVAESTAEEVNEEAPEESEENESRKKSRKK